MTPAERLQAQLEYLRSDDRLRELAALAAESTPEERLEQAWAMSRSAAAVLVSGAADDRVREEIAAAAAPVLRRLAGLARPGRDDAAAD